METKKIIVRVMAVAIGLPAILFLTASACTYALDRSSGTIVSGDRKRQHLLYVPPSYDPAKPTPLVISMHAAAMWPAQQMNLSRWNRLADEFGFIVVYPAGSGRSGHRGSGT
jgi:polyhydroxybutyrate depolymerase